MLIFLKKAKAIHLVGCSGRLLVYVVFGLNFNISALIREANSMPVYAVSNLFCCVMYLKIASV